MSFFFTEFAAGLTILCKGAREDKVRSAFDLCDLNGDGYPDMVVGDRDGKMSVWRSVAAAGAPDDRNFTIIERALRRYTTGDGLLYWREYGRSIKTDVGTYASPSLCNNYTGGEVLGLVKMR